MQSMVGKNKCYPGDDSIGAGVKNWDTQKLKMSQSKQHSSASTTLVKREQLRAGPRKGTQCPN